MRFALLIVSVCLMAIAPAAATCEYRPEWRGRDTASFVADAEACLAAPKAGFRIDPAVEQEVFDRVNAARREAGRAPLEHREALLRPARLHSFDMAQDWFFAHEGPDGRSVSERVAALDRTLIHSEIRENIAKIGGDLNWADTGEILHNILFESDGHRENMLSPRLTHMAMGVVRTDDGAWITQIFVRLEGQFTRPVPASLSAAEPQIPGVQMADWAHGETRLLIDNKQYPSTALDPTLRGEANLIVKGTRALSEFRFESINLIGPSTTLRK